MRRRVKTPRRGCWALQPFDDPQLYFEASPLRQVRYARNALKTLLIHGDRDNRHSACCSRKASPRPLRQARFNVRTLSVPGAGHFWFSEEPVQQGTFSGYNR